MARPLRTKKQVKDFFAEQAQRWPLRREIAFLLQDWSDPYNVGGLFRVADACGASLVVGTGKTPGPDHPAVPVPSMGHHRRIPWRHYAVHEEAALAMKAEGWSLAVIEVSDEAVPLWEAEWPDRVCLVLGNEQTGLYPSVARHADSALFIPMYGKGRSMNVHVAAAIAGFQAAISGPKAQE